MSVSALPSSLHAKLSTGDDATIQTHLLAFLARQRWFRSHGAPPQRVVLHAIAPLSNNLIWAIARVTEHDGSHTDYQLPLVTCEAAQVPERAVVLTEVPQMPGHVLADAAQHAGARDKLLNAIISQGRIPAGDGFWEARTFADTRALISQPSMALKGEQSNTSVIYGKHAMLKLFRCVQPGNNPDVEMTQYLTVHHPLACVPRLLGTMTYQAADGTAFDAAMLQEYIADGTDGWAAELTALTGWLRDGADPLRLPGRDSAAELGRTLRRVHEALAQPRGDDKQFVAQHASSAQAMRWVEEARAQAVQTLQNLRTQHVALDEPQRATAAVLLARLQRAGLDLQAAAAQLVPSLADLNDAGACIRHHGDLHLGQVLKRADGSFVILDFEGEPLRPLAMRRRPHSPLRDVAGMLRSFAYAAATASREPAADGAAAKIWQKTVCNSFVTAYRDGKANSKLMLLPRDAANQQALLRLFVREKALYELRYELMHRPTWVGVPLAAVVQALNEEEAT